MFIYMCLFVCSRRLVNRLVALLQLCKILATANQNYWPSSDESGAAYRSLFTPVLCTANGAQRSLNSVQLQNVSCVWKIRSETDSNRTVYDWLNKPPIIVQYSKEITKCCDKKSSKVGLKEDMELTAEDKR